LKFSTLSRVQRQAHHATHVQGTIVHVIASEILEINASADSNFITIFVKLNVDVAASIIRGST